MGGHMNHTKFLVTLILGGMFVVSGCSGHTVKYGANSEGEEIVAGEEPATESAGQGHTMTKGGEESTSSGDMGEGMSSNLRVDEEVAGMAGSTDPQTGEITTSSDMANSNGESGVSDYGHDYDGVDGVGPNHGPVTGFGKGSASKSTMDPEAWANAYLRDGSSEEEFYGDPANMGSSGDTQGTMDSATSDSGVSTDGGPPSQGGANYGHEYDGVPGSGPQHGSVDGFSGGSASATQPDPQAWSKAYLGEQGGPDAEYVEPGVQIARANDGGDPGTGRTTMAYNQTRSGQNAGGYSDSQDHLQRGQSLGSMLNGTAGGRVQDIYFAFDSWNISSEAAKYLTEGATWLQKNPEHGLTIEGHCDQRGTQDYNLVLGKKRAEAAREYLVNLGVAPDRIRVVSYGKERPFCQNHNEDCFQENRRSHMVVRAN